MDGESVGSQAQSDARGSDAPIIPRYQTIAKLGEGGNGVVYKAKDLTLDRIVALKFLLSNDVEQKARFLQEARAAASLSHPNVCVVHEVGEAQGKPYIVMEFVEGEDLRSKVSNGPLEFPEALSLVVQAAEGLREAHHKDIVHRDVKSANIMVTEAGRAKVTDFGLARSMNDTKITKTGVRLGTPSFMSPEQALGNEVDQRSDIWSLCVVLYELVAGQLPFKGEVEASVAYSIVHEEHQPLTSLRSGLPLDLDYVLEKGLEKDPDDRYQHIDDLIVDLREIIDQSATVPDAGASVRLRASAASRRVRKRASKWFSPQRVSLLAAVLAGLALFAVLTVQDPASSPADSPEVATVTVLPITATGGAAELQVFTDGLIETITRRLSQYENENEQLVVVSPSEVLRQQVATPSDAFAKFGSRYAIEGSLQSEGEAVRLVLTLVETASGSQVDTAVIDGRRDAALSLQDSAVDRLATLLKLTVSDEHAAELARLRPAAPGAYEFYLQARGYLRRNDRLQDIDSAIEVFGRALEADPDYALALSGLCEAYWYRYQRTKETEWVPKAREKCNRAIELSDDVAEVHVTMGTLQRGTSDYGKALLSFQRAVELDGRSGEAFSGLARTYESLGALDKAEATFHQGVRLRPADWNAYKQLGLFYFRHAQYEKAIEQYDEVVRLTPDNAHGYTNLGVLYYRLGKLDLGEEMTRRSAAIEPRATTLSNLGKLLSEQGRLDEAADYYQQAIDLAPLDHRKWANLASALRRKGDAGLSRQSYDKAIELVTQALTVEPKNAGLSARLAHYLVARGDRERAAVLLTQLASDEIKEPEVLMLIAETFAQLGRIDDAIKLANRAFGYGFQVESLDRESSIFELMESADYATRFENPRRPLSTRLPSQ